jgi:3-deoxy-D-manno-octulosonic acid (KDO) 8-phosphate synthase
MTSSRNVAIGPPERRKTLICAARAREKIFRVKVGHFLSMWEVKEKQGEKKKEKSKNQSMDCDSSSFAENVCQTEYPLME